MKSLKRADQSTPSGEPVDDQQGPGEGSDGHLTAAIRHRMISEVAFYRAECRDFECGHELDDWLAAEAQVDAMLACEVKSVRSKRETAEA